MISILSNSIGHPFSFPQPEPGALGDLLGHTVLLLYLLWGQAVEGQKGGGEVMRVCQLKRKVLSPQCFGCRLLPSPQGYLGLWHENREKKKKDGISTFTLSIILPTP